MPFEFQARNTVVRGEFNRAIIVPKWLADQEIVPHGEAELLLSNSLDMPRVFRVGGFEWTVGHDRLVVKPLGAADLDTGGVVAHVLRTLQHTPVSAIGHNFVFLDAGEGERLEPAMGATRAPDLQAEFGGNLRSSTFEIAVAIDEDITLTAKVIVEPGSQKVDINFHSVIHDAGQAADSAERSVEFRERANAILATLAGAH